jgi:hypothetical protein
MEFLSGIVKESPILGWLVTTVPLQLTSLAVVVAIHLINGTPWSELIILLVTVFATLAVFRHYSPKMFQSAQTGMGMGLGWNMVGGNGANGSGVRNCKCRNPFSKRLRLRQALIAAGYQPNWTMHDIDTMAKTPTGLAQLEQIDTQARTAAQVSQITHGDLAYLFPDYYRGFECVPALKGSPGQT